jgi:hypothetical protein
VHALHARALLRLTNAADTVAAPACTRTHALCPPCREVGNDDGGDILLPRGRISWAHSSPQSPPARA